MWTDERLEQAKAWVADGLTSREIADRLGEGVSRNAVIGKLRRAGVQCGGGRRCGPAPKERPPKKVKAKPPKPKSKHFRFGFGARAQSPVPLKATPVKEPAPPPEVMMLGILQLGPTTCKFPIGDPRNVDFGYCGHKRQGTSPYCEYHHRLAYQPVRRVA